LSAQDQARRRRAAFRRQSHRLRGGQCAGGGPRAGATGSPQGSVGASSRGRRCARFRRSAPSWHASHVAAHAQVENWHTPSLGYLRNVRLTPKPDVSLCYSAGFPIRGACKARCSINGLSSPSSAPRLSVGLTPASCRLGLARTSLSDAALQRFHQVHDVASGRTLRFFRNDRVPFIFFVDETRLRSSDWSR
jgi:hypothetical protein